jgi:hypothetical protein
MKGQDGMVTIGVDLHKQTHTAAAVDELGSEVEHRTVPARPAGNGQLLEWARGLDSERVWAVEDVRNVSGSLERFLIDRGETVVRLAPQLMAGARRGVRTRGKSDPIDATAIARAALREGIETLPTARLAGPEREIRMLALYREGLLDMRTRLSNELRWQLHDPWPDWGGIGNAQRTAGVSEEPAGMEAVFADWSVRHLLLLSGVRGGGSTSSSAPNPASGPSIRNISIVRSGSTCAWLRNASTLRPVSSSIMSL